MDNALSIKTHYQTELIIILSFKNNTTFSLQCDEEYVIN